jgi:hypothetical protein
MRRGWIGWNIGWVEAMSGGTAYEAGTPFPPPVLFGSKYCIQVAYPRTCGSPCRALTAGGLLVALGSISILADGVGWVCHGDLV